MSDDDSWGDDNDDSWGDDNDDGGDNGWDENDFDNDFNDPYSVAQEAVSPLEQSFQEADSLFSLRDKEGSLTEFERFIQLSEESGNPKPQLKLEALSKMVRISVDLSRQEESIRWYAELLSCLKKHGYTQNEKKNAISDVLCQFDLQRNPVAEEFYLKTINEIEEEERLWFDFSMELCHAFLEMQLWDKLNPVLERLHNRCRLSNGQDDPGKADLLIQIYAVKIEKMYQTDDTRELETIYHLTQNLKSNVSDHRSAPIIAEFNGKYHAEQRDYQTAMAEFFQAIKYADPNRGKLCVKYLVCVTMLSSEGTDPFASREVKIYESDRQVEPMVNLYQYFNANQIYDFDQKLEKESWCFEDKFIEKLMPSIKLKLRRKALVAKIQPYNRVSLTWLRSELWYTTEETEQLLISMILDGSILARINQVDQTLEIRKSANTQILTELRRWSVALQTRQASLVSQINRIDSNKGGSMGHHMQFDMFN